MTFWTFYRLDPKAGAGFHFGQRGLEGESSAEFCPSDTLFGALVATLADLDGREAVRAFVAPFREGEPPFLLTSLFPRAGDLPLLPLPRLRIELTPEPGQRKLLKRLRYVSPRLFGAILRGEEMDAYAGEERGRFLQKGRVWLSADEQPRLPQAWRDLSFDALREQKLWQADAVDRVTIDRASSASAVYRVGRTAYAPECGLWLGARWPRGVDVPARDQLKELLHHLGDRGLGGERSVGYGQFELGETPPELTLPETNGPLALSLSRYLPAGDELPGVLGEGASYGLVGVIGWLGSAHGPARRRRSVRMLTEGSILRAGGQNGPLGRLVDLKPVGWEQHPVWRYGYACTVGVGEVLDA